MFPELSAPGPPPDIQIAGPELLLGPMLSTLVCASVVSLYPIIQPE